MDNLNSEYNKKLSFRSEELSDYEASMLLDHKKEDESSHICMKDGIDLYLFGCITVQSPSGQFVYGKDVMDYLINNAGATRSEVLNYLQGENVDSLLPFTITTNPWFEWQERDGETVGEVFDAIPSDIEKLSVPE